MNKNFNYLTIASCFILGMSLAYADSDSSQGKMDDKIFKMDQKMFKDMDKDSDGKVTKNEFKDYQKNKFNVVDFNTWDVDGNDDINVWEMKIVSQRNASEQKPGGGSGEGR